MKKNFKHRFVLTAFCMMGFSQLLLSQSIYKIIDSKDIDMKLLGTSTLHKWSMDAKTFEGEARFIFSSVNVNELTSLKSLGFSLEVQDLKSGEKALDNNAYKALKTNQYKDIVYKLTSATVSPEKENRYIIMTKGNLTVAGVTKQITMKILCVVNPDGTITCTGSDKLNMTDYHVKPPSFMLGAMKTGDEITLDFKLVYKKQTGI